MPPGVEVRNKAWMTVALGDCLRRHGAVWVLPDQVWMPISVSVVERLAQHLWAHGGALFTFLRQPGLDALDKYEMQAWRA
jgi:hypothetical protein